jgi:hypothetical protein
MLALSKFAYACAVLVVAPLPQPRVARADYPSESWVAAPCGKVCKLICEKKKLTAIGYGYQCEDICIPAPSRHGCKHCDTTCCAGDDMKGCHPQIEFCWYDWFACGCAQPRTIRLLTKYQAEKELPSYHWEVVDASCCDSQNGTTMNDGGIYKAAPPDAQLGDVIALTDEEWRQLSPQLMAAQSVTPPQVPNQQNPAIAPMEPEQKEVSIAERFQRVFRR